MREIFRASLGDGCLRHLLGGKLWPPHPVSQSGGPADQVSGNLHLRSPATATVLVTCTQYPGRKFCTFYRGEAGLGGGAKGLQRALATSHSPFSSASLSTSRDSQQPRLSLEPMTGTGCQALLQRGCLRVLSSLLILVAFLAIVLWCQQVLSRPGGWGYRDRTLPSAERSLWQPFVPST